MSSATVPLSAAEELARLSLSDTTALAARLANGDDPFTDLLNEINTARQQLGTSPLTDADLAQAIARIASLDGNTMPKPPLGALGTVFALVCLLTVARAIWQPRQPSKQVIVATDTGLPPYHQIVARDLTLKAGPPEARTIGRAEDVIGRYTTRAVGAGNPIHTDDISAGLKIPIAGRTVLSVGVRPADLALANAFPAQVDLLFSTIEKQTLVKDVVLLMLTRDTPMWSATVAIAPEKLASLGPLLATSNATIIWSSDAVAP